MQIVDHSRIQIDCQLRGCDGSLKTLDQPLRSVVAVVARTCCFSFPNSRCSCQLQRTKPFQPPETDSSEKRRAVSLSDTRRPQLLDICCICRLRFLKIVALIARCTHTHPIWLIYHRLHQPVPLPDSCSGIIAESDQFGYVSLGFVLQ